MAEHLRVVIAQDYEELSRLGAELVVNELRSLPELLLCVATGASPLGTYRNLAERCRRAPGLFRGLRVVKLDEWGLLRPDDPASCEFYIQREIIEPLGISPSRYLTLQGDVSDPEAECRCYAAALRAIAPIDVCVLGMAANGHLGLNEPAEALQEGVHVAQLAKETRSHGMLANARTPPTYGLTLGMGDILRSRRILLLVSGVSKREAMRQLAARRISTQFPASLLWTHGDVTVICDSEAHPERQSHCFASPGREAYPIGASAVEDARGHVDN